MRVGASLVEEVALQAIRVPRRGSPQGSQGKADQIHETHRDLHNMGGQSFCVCFATMYAMSSLIFVVCFVLGKRGFIL